MNLFFSRRPPGLPALRLRALALAFVAALVSPPVLAQSGEALTLQAAVTAATSQSRLLAADRLQTQAARERAVAAGQLPDPVLKLSLTNLPIDGPDRFTLGRDFMTMRSVGVMQEFTRAGKRRARTRLAEREVEASVVAQRQTAAELQQGAALAWLERSFQESLRELLIGQQARAELEVEAADSLYRSGKGAQADVFTARSQVELIKDRITEAERRIAVAKAQLARWIGDAAGRPIAPRPTLVRPIWTGGDLTAAVTGQPRIAVALQQEAVAQAEAEVARAERRSDWSVEVMYSKRGSAFSDMASINLSVPLQWRQGERQDRELAAKLAMVEEARAQREDLQRAREAEIRAMLQEWQSHEERLRRHDAALLPLAEQRSRAALSAYRAGTGALPTVLEARRDAIEVHMERLDVETDIARLWAELEFLDPRSDAGTGTSSTLYPSQKAAR
ncbi:MAG: TolC family protein [Methylibium sp.]|uniref:TolC family protein n=1 Tax=Methylibium sp. TaxID=2067992 RepID=UPI0017CE94A3|nr:TolC family protein [Methylibium sp.]MBA3597765.1 TolC family protein [Methylibium sp.]